MAVLKDILYGVHLKEVLGPTDVEVTNVQLDSRKVGQGSLFVAISGTVADGHAYIPKAIELGAKAIICEQPPADIKHGVSYIIVEDSREAVGVVAANYYDNPSTKIKLVGITGTNGKTSTATMLFKLVRAMGFSAGLLSTVENKIDDKVIPATHTTPDPVSLNAMLAQMVAHGCEYAFMEVSSHAIHQKRIAGIVFTGAAFTNLTHEHLDYHKTFKDYLEAKKALFDGLPATAFALSNFDDKNGLVMLQNTKARKLGYALRKPADFKAKILENNFTGLLLIIDNEELHTRLVGEFNAYNLLAVYGVAMLLGLDKMEVLTTLSSLSSAEGRFDYLVSEQDGVVGIVDYAHTPDALKKVLETIKGIRTGQEQVISIVGCGGDRDKTKRPLMAEVACLFSDKVILTSDNPRTEDPEAIIEDMKAGVPPAAKKKVLSISSRKEAIRTAIQLAQEKDIILVAGKGHEKYQEINGVKHPFDDKQILLETFKELDK